MDAVHRSPYPLLAVDPVPPCVSCHTCAEGETVTGHGYFPNLKMLTTSRTVTPIRLYSFPRQAFHSRKKYEYGYSINNKSFVGGGMSSPSLDAAWQTEAPIAAHNFPSRPPRRQQQRRVETSAEERYRKVHEELLASEKKLREHFVHVRTATSEASSAEVAASRPRLADTIECASTPHLHEEDSLGHAEKALARVEAAVVAAGSSRSTSPRARPNRLAVATAAARLHEARAALKSLRGDVQTNLRALQSQLQADVQQAFMARGLATPAAPRSPRRSPPRHPRNLP
jgi:Skp family chaperone for outer membrane proteins